MTSEIDALENIDAIIRIFSHAEVCNECKTNLARILLHAKMSEDEKARIARGKPLCFCPQYKVPHWHNGVSITQD